jgi:hypothetical protein
MDDLVRDWGYVLLDPSHADSLGHGGLVVALRHKPTGKHFDPETLYLRLRDRTGTFRGMTLSWTAPPLESGHVCPGRVILADRADKRVEFFTFGGSLERVERPDEVVYTLRSPTPVLELLGQGERISDQLAFETESLLSGAAAHWGHDERGFGQCLAAVDPLQFYVAVLQSLLLRHKRVVAMETVYPELDDALLREKRGLQARGLWPAEPPVLEDLLSPRLMVSKLEACPTKPS